MLKENIILLIFFIIANAYGQSDCLLKDVIIWNDSMELRIEDFKSITPPLLSSDTPYKGKNRAISVCEIQLLFSSSKIKNEILVCPTFSRSESWIDTSGLELYDIKHILNHELGHFNIIEYASRLIRKGSDNLWYNSCLNKAEFDILVAEVGKEIDSLNYEYDMDTLHGAIFSKQDEWNKKIQQLLDSLAQYSSPNYSDVNYRITFK